MNLKTHNRIKWRYLVVFTLILLTHASLNAQNNGLTFDGVEEEAQVGPLSIFDGVTNQSFTIEAWFNPAQTVNKGTVWSIGVNTGENLRLKQVADGGMALDNIDGDVIVGSSPDIAINRWHHSAVVYDGTELILYIDGIEEGRTSIALTMEGTGFRIGRGTFDFSNFWEGSIDEIRIWNYARTSQEILDYLFLNVDGTESGLVHGYNFNQTTGTVLPDITGAVNGSTVNMEDGNWSASQANEKIANIALGTGLWSNAGIWNTSVPIPIDSVVIATGSSVTLDSDISAYDLVVQTTASIVQSGSNISILGDIEMTNSGSLTSNANDTIFLKGEDQEIKIALNTIGTLSLEGSGTKTFTEDTEVNGGVLIEADASMSILSSGFMLTQTAFFNSSSSNPIAGTLNFSGTAHSIASTSLIEGISVSSAATITLASDLSLLSDFTISNQGILDMQSFTITAPNSWNLSGVDTIRWATGARIIIDKNMSSFSSGVGFGPINTTYPTMEIVDNGYLFLSDNLYINDSDSIIIDKGFLSGNFSILTLGIASAVEVKTGTFECESCDIGMGNNATIVNNGGNLIFRGGEGDTKVNGNDAGQEYEIINNDGSVEFRETQFENLKGGGITFNGGQIGSMTSLQFSNSTNADAYITFGGVLEDNLTFNNIEFSAGPANNVRKLAASGTGNVNMAATFGDFTGPSFELVEAGTITWVNFDLYDDFGLNFAGTGQHILIPGGPDFTSPFTVEAWVKPSNVGSGTIVGWDLDAGSGEYATFGFSSGALQIYAEDGINGGPFNDGQQIPAFSWTHVAVTYNGAAFQFYVNGEPTASGLPVGSVGGSPSNLYIGSRNGTAEFFNGTMDEVRIWGDIRTEAEIKDNIFNELTGSEAGLLNYYNFNEAAGTVLTDLTGTPENGILTAFSGDDSEWVPTTDKPESFEYALHFDGVDDFVTVSGLNYENDFTLEAWVRLDDNNGSHTIASWDFDTSPYAAFRITDGFAEFETFDGATASTVVAPDSIAPLDWYHIAMVKQGVDVEIFINGFSKITGTISDVAGSSNFRIGNYESESELGFLDGQLDELRFWNTALDLQTIRDYAGTRDFTGHPDIGNFLYYADFNQAVIPGGNNTGFNTLPDLTSSGFTGTLDPGFALNGFNGNFVLSEAFEAVNITLYANDIEISEFSSSNISVNDNTDFGAVLIDNQLTREFLIINNGFNVAIIDEVASIPSGYQAELSNVLIQPFDTVTLTVTFEPESIGDRSGNIDIFYSFFETSDSFNLTIGGLGYPNESGPGNALSPNLGQMVLSEASPYAFSKNDAFSMEAWVKVRTTANQSFFNNINGTGIEFASQNGTLAVRFVYSIVGGEEITSTAPAVNLPEQEWAHVAFTYNGSGIGTGIRFYVNGAYIGQGTSTATSVNDLNTDVNPPVLASYASAGAMDEFRIWGIELTAQQIRENYLNNYDPSTSDLISYFRFDEEEGATEIIDLKNNSVGTFSLDPMPALVVSHVPLNNESTFDGLSGKNALWTVGQDEVPSANMQIFNSGFLQDDGDNIVFAHDFPGALDGATVTSNLSALQPLVDERLERSWYIEISDSTTNEGGEIDILFEDVPNDSIETYYLLSTFEGISDYIIVPYDGYNTSGDSVFFRVQVDSIPEKAFFTLGRANVFPGNALAFDGINDSTSTSSGVSHNDEFTYEAWIKVDPSSDDLGGLITLEGSFGSFITATVLGDGKLSFALNDGSFTESVNSTSSVRDGNWHHFAVSRDFTNGLRIYVDGVFEDTASPVLSAAFFNGNISLGINRAGSIFSKFAIDEFRIWNKARTAEQISENYETTVSPSNPDLVLYNRFDQLSENLPDLSQNTTPSGLYNFDFDFSTSGWVTSEAFEFIEIENALSFDGVDDFVQVPTLNAPSGSFTLEAWVNYEGVAPEQFETIIEFGNDNPYFGLLEGTPTLFGAAASPNPLVQNVWTHLAVTFNSIDNTSILYVDGLEVSQSDAAVTRGGVGMGIGFNSGNNAFPGLIDDVRVWDRVLSQTEIQGNIVKEVSPQAANLLAFYDFNIGTPGGDNMGITILPDLTGNHNGNITNFDLNGASSNFVESTTPPLEPQISVSINGVEFINNGDLDYGVVFDADEAFTEVVVRNAGLDTLRLSGAVDYGVSVNLFDDLPDTKIEPFSSDTIRFGYAPTATVSSEQLLTIFSDDPTNPTFSLTASALVYNNLPGAGNALSLDGVSDVATTPNNVDDLTNESFTVEFWAKRASNTTDDFVFGSGPVTSAVTNDQLHIGFKTGDVVTMSFQGDDLDYIWTDANADWNHFAMSYNVADGKQKIHINGIAVDSTFASGNYVGLGQFYVGAAPFGGNFEGSIEELRVWSFALPDSVIRTHMTRKLGSDEDFFPDSLIAYYRFDEGSGTDIFDLAENSSFGINHLNLTGGAFEPSGAYVGDGNLFTYDATEIDTNPVGSVIKLSNIADPSKGVHLFAIVDNSSSEVSSDIYQSVRTDEIFGVFAPGGNTFDFNYGTGSFGTDDSLRIVKRVDNTAVSNYFTVSNLFGVDTAEDSVRAFNQTSGIFSIAKINYPSLPGAGTALNFSDASESVVLNEPALETMGDFTVELWVNIPSSSTTSQRNFFEQEDVSAMTDRQLVQLSTANGTLYYFIRPSNGGAQSLEFGSQNIADDQWHHVAFIRTGSTLNMYIDGALDRTSDLGFATDIVFPANALTSIHGKGGVDEMRIWNTSLDINVMRDYIFTNEIANHPNLSELKGYYRFDDDAPSTNVLDLAANNNGSLTLPGDWVASGAFSVPSNTVVSFADDGPGSLRDVIRIANQTVAMDTIKFDLPGTGPWVINSKSNIVATDSIYIDGTTQPGWDLATGQVIEIEGATNSVTFGIDVQSAYAEVYGLRINGFGLGIRVNSSTNSKIGDVGKQNIFVNNTTGITLSDANNSLVRNNLIGIDFDGSSRGNSTGIELSGSSLNNIIGGSTAEANNIQFNNSIGVLVSGPAVGNLIRQNVIVRNTGNGIFLFDSGNGIGNNNITAPVITTVSDVAVSGTGIDGQEIDVYLADATGVNQAESYLGTTTVSGGVWTLTGLSLSEGDYVTATANTVTDGTSVFATVVRFALAPADPTVISANFNTLEPIITGTYEVGTDLTVEIDGTTYVLGVDAQLTDVADVDSDGITDWALDLTGFPLSGQGVFDVVVTSTNTVVSISASDQTTDEILIDTTLPTPPAVNDLITNNDRPTLTGTFEIGTNLEILLNTVTYVLGVDPELTDDGLGNWTLNLSTLATGLPENTYDVLVTSTDIALNSATDNSADELVIDLTAPVVAVNSDVTQVVSPEINGTVDDNSATINVTIDGNNYIATNNGDGSWTIAAGTITPDLAEGTYEVAVSASDLALNTATDASNNELVIVVNPVAADATEIEPFSFTANWNAQDGITNYVLEVSADNAFTQLVAGFDNTPVSGIAQSVNGLAYGTPYFYRVRSVLSPGDTTDYSNTIAVKTIVSAETIADSTALVNIYNDMNGVNWTNNTNWLQPGQRIETWEGVNVDQGRVVSISLINNNLNGTFPVLSTGELDALQTLSLADNEISGLSDLTGLASITSLQVQNNQLTFADLEVNASITGIEYIPQAVILEEMSEFVDDNQDFTLDRGTGNPGDVYSWFKNEVPVPGEVNSTLVLANISFADEGTYRASVTNTNVPGLTLETTEITVKVSSLERDSLSLRQLYVEMNGDSWGDDINDWTTLPIAQWTGIGINNNRVDSLNLSGQGLVGTFPNQILDVLNLRYVNISENDVENIPDLTSLVNLTTLDLTDNRLHFDDLIPNTGITGIDFSNQKPVDELLSDIYLPSGSDFELSVDVGGEGNNYEWKFGTEVIQTGSNPAYQITGIQRADMGFYQCEITNSAIPGFTLNSNVRGVFAKAMLSGTTRISDSELLTDGRVLLFQVNDGAYDTIDVFTLDVTGTYTFDTLLADYLILVDPTDNEAYIPTYHESTIQWDLAAVVPLNNDTTGIDIQVTPRPGDITGGDGTFIGDVFTDFPDDGRIEARRRVRRVGVALRRRRSSNRTDEDIFDLVGYTQTDEEGKFSFGELPAGLYRIFIEYPGIPLREDAFTEFEITADGKNNDVTITATVFEDGIEILGGITGIAKDYLDELTFYPNPVSDGKLFVKIQAQRGYNIMFELIDLRGKTVLQESLNNQNVIGGRKQISIESLTPGMYIIRVTIPELDNQVYNTGKLIIRGNN